MNSCILTIAYKGTNYCGWQVQPNKPTVQETLQKAIQQVLGKEITLTGCSRTDSGVHAKGFVALVKGDDLPDIPMEALPFAINTVLPNDISVLMAENAPDDFHPRYNALGKEYVYRIRNSRIKDPFSEETAWLFQRYIDVDIAEKLCADFVGKHDFRSFMAAGSKIVDTVREIKYFNVERLGDDVIFTVAADGFLYNMVRIMVGTVAEKASGTKLPEIQEILKGCDRSLAGTTAPAKGLFLNKVFY